MIYYIYENNEYSIPSCDDILFEMMDICSDIYDICSSGYVDESTISTTATRLITKVKMFIDSLIQKIKNFFAEKKINDTVSKYEKVFKNKSDRVDLYVKILKYDDIADITNTKYNEYISDIIQKGIPINDVKQKLENDIKNKYHSGNINASINEIIQYLKDYKVVYKELNTVKSNINEWLKKDEFDTITRGNKGITKITTTFLNFSMYMANKLTSEYIKSCNSIINALSKLAHDAFNDSEDDVK